MKNFLPILFSVLILTFLTGLGIMTIIHFVVDNKNEVFTHQCSNTPITNEDTPTKTITRIELLD